ncbi:MAG: hypothetical protein ABEK50_06165 [bacterium]
MGQKTFVLSLLLALALVAGPAGAQQADTPTASEQTGEQEVDFQFQLGFNALTKGNLDEAVRHLKNSVEQDTPVPKAYHWLGKTYFYQGYNDSAVAILQKAETFPSVRERVQTELNAHDLLYRADTFSFHNDWSYIGLIKGEEPGKNRNINPSAIEGDPYGGWYSSSYSSGRVLKYSEEGKVLRTWDGFESPTDLEYVDNQLLVAEMAEDRVSVLTDTGSRQDFLTEGVEAPSQLLSIDETVFVVDSTDQAIIQMTENGDTAGVVWEAPVNVSVSDISVGPDGNFWVLDDHNYSFHVISPGGLKLTEHSWNRNLALRKIWWRRGTLISVGKSGVLSLDPDDFSATALSARGDTLPGADVSDIHLSGDRLIISSFESSQLLLYRPPEVEEPDLLVDQRRFDFADFPVIRANLVLRDPLHSERFEHLDDKNFGLSVNNLDILPSFLRHTRRTYGNDWILLIDNRISRMRAWEEVEPFLERLINRAPAGTRGSLWSVKDEEVVKQSFTEYPVELTNSLNRLNFYSGKSVTTGDTLLARRLHQAFNILFSRRSSGGIIVVSRRLPESSPALERVYNRAINNSVPVAFVNPSINPPPSKILHQRAYPLRYQNFGQLSVQDIWKHYKNYQNRHYTAIYRSNLRFQPSSLWRNVEFRFHYFDRVHRYRGGFLIE